ncbi:alanyl-tRNA editing protein [Paenisporosarcina indica]|uniref:alanyl-tRNA editing protein n=1 Tax=Paenisporosarcina indica TaxID=650093 RepID=UPI00094F4D11|nr:DHHA1 domain-containing protein [Paenisporosarcina indica]
MKQKYYYQDAYQKNANTTIISQAQEESGRWYITLQETIFYPTGGGQPHDTGLINGVQVTDVEEVDGEIRHYIGERSTLETGESVGIEIDWTRRFDFMQQHAGQHILTASFVELLGIQTVSFHLGKEHVTIDVDASKISNEQLGKVEKLANQIILENRLIETKWVTKDELAQYPLRKQVSVDEDIRLVIIPDFDYNGCGGTHPSSTGQIGALKILDTEKQKGKVRVHFVCGGRVITQLHRKHTVLQEMKSQLSASEEGLAEAARTVVDNGKKMEKTIEELREQLMGYEVKEILGELTQGNVSIERVFQQRSIQELQKLARLLVAESPKCKVIFIAENEGLLQFVLASGAENDTNMKQLASQIFPLINGKGGGSASFAQGGGTKNQSGQELVEKIHQLMV